MDGRRAFGLHPPQEEGAGDAGETDEGKQAEVLDIGKESRLALEFPPHRTLGPVIPPADVP